MYRKLVQLAFYAILLISVGLSACKKDEMQESSADVTETSDPSSLLVSRIHYDATNRTDLFTYDQDNRLVTFRSQEILPGNVPFERIEQYQYNANGKVNRIITSYPGSENLADTAAVKYVDEHTALVTFQRRDENGEQKVFKFEFDKAGQLMQTSLLHASINIEDQTNYTFTREANNVLMSTSFNENVNANLVFTTAYAYDATNNPLHAIAKYNPFFNRIVRGNLQVNANELSQNMVKATDWSVTTASTTYEVDKTTNYPLSSVTTYDDPNFATETAQYAYVAAK
ncbi:hypothetical protein LX64_01935 [Chitinophaga skermanii]|uniref:YD repeat-containing protein n=1 Tax=Chitinophaga skermanii TaxID=331697 RepID=A0A327QS82_9BACT|nr:hypothetical protein [Chitinophaga skermanii]RAJ06808.1 hypothetical protein LX64_01935 [Chitinophaga skermanii]